MARKKRVWFPGAMYHITSRGNRRTALFYDNKDYKMYLNILEVTRKRYPFYLHSYCLMTNHIHLQVETIDHHLKYMMKHLNSRYAMYFNRRHHYDGHLFQGRYGAELIIDKSYELEVSKYIHLNPVDAKMVKSPEQYRWSSYRAYISTEHDDPHVETEKILAYFSKPKEENYRKYVTNNQILEECKGFN